MYSKPHWSFGAGRLYYRPPGGTPIKVATLQGVDIDISGSPKDLIGENQFPEATVRAGTKITGKVQSGRFDGRVISNLFFGASETAGTIQQGLLVPVENQPAQIGADGTVTPPLGSATFDTDLGPTDPKTGWAFKRVDENPAEGEYVVDIDTGEYTFDVASSGRSVLLSYIKSDASLGETTTIANDLMGEAPTFGLISYDKKILIELYSCQFSKLSLQRKNEDFLIPNMEFGASADDVLGVGRISMTTA
ncbi:hypothetical protein [Paraburkholderia sp. J11-2]|uniref:hypothetical protein n=1 Tax=Paraburkholderia sp. J11-2 TaxID=2805431 RepID=UPI002AB6A658|nr:hypothetical protein [Paraburkholderia sp. J11-2]